VSTASVPIARFGNTDQIVKEPTSAKRRIPRQNFESPPIVSHVVNGPAYTLANYSAGDIITDSINGITKTTGRRYVFRERHNRTTLATTGGRVCNGHQPSMQYSTYGKVPRRYLYAKANPFQSTFEPDRRWRHPRVIAYYTRRLRRRSRKQIVIEKNFTAT